MTRTVLIENPVLNSPFREPARHFRTTADGEVTGEVVERRRPSEFFVPVAKPKKSGTQLSLDALGPPTRQQPNEIVNEIRQAVARWRAQGYPHATPTTRELLAHWRSDDRERRLFFCQVEAAETAIFLAEAAARIGDTKALNVIAAENARLNAALPRLAMKMATGSGKTVVMAMLIAWQALNKLADPYDKRFSTRFLVITPGITIRDRLRVLLPNDPGNYYRAMDLVTPEQLDRLQAATVLVTNFHALIRREKIEAAGLTKRILAGEDAERFKETPAEMVRRACNVFGTARNIVVLNDEAHHCYAPAPVEDGERPLDADERAEAVVDVGRGIMAIDAELHSDQEAALLDDGSRQADLWGVNFYPADHGTRDWLEYDSMINLRPSEGNRSRSVDDPATRQRIAGIVDRLVQP